MAKPIKYIFSCTVDDLAATSRSYQNAWNSPAKQCQATRISGTEYSQVERQAVATAYGAAASMNSLDTFYGICAQIDGYYAYFESGNGSGTLSDSLAAEAAGALTLCPDHPNAALIQANTDAVTVASAAADEAAAAASAQAQAPADGTYVESGNYLIGSEVQVGTWQTPGEKVANCYWSITAADGSIIENDFIEVAPQITITVPPNAAGFTVQGCSFSRIGD